MRLTLRARLTLVYGGLFVAAGVALLTVTYLLVSRRVGGGGSTQVTDLRVPPDLAGQPMINQTVANEVAGDALETLLVQGGLALLVISVVAVSLGWLIAGRMLQPVQRVTEAARRIADAPADGRGLHERIALTGPRDELRALADTFDLMLERLDQAFDGQRRFIANASHELRTPLTLNRALLEVAVHRKDAGEQVRQLGGTLLEINSRHGRLIDGLLLLARSTAGAVGERSYVDLADIVAHVSDLVPPGGHVTLRTAAKEAPTSGNAVLLERLVQNLVENGLRHNVPAPLPGWVSVSCDTAGGTVSLEVANSGPVVPPYEVPGLFEPFRRHCGERSAGAGGVGLGLSIVAAIASAHGGTVRATPRDGGGLTVVVTLPHANDLHQLST